MQMGASLWHLFTTILLFCTPSQPDQLWLHFRTHICDNLSYRLCTLGINNPSTNDVYNYGLHIIDTILHESGHTLHDWPSMPTVQWLWEQYSTNEMIAEQLNYNRDSQHAYWESHYHMLNTEQSNAYHEIMHSIKSGSGGIFMISGHGGTGKTFLYKVVCAKLRSKGTIVLCMASSGIAVLLLPGGCTAHSMFKIPIEGLSQQSFCCIPKDSARADLMRAVECIIWDEIGPQHRYSIKSLDYTLCDLTDKDEPFGGITMLMGGYFQQTLPVIPKGSRKEILNATITHSHLWDDINIIHLHQNMHLRDDPQADEFAKWLLDIGHGRNSDENGEINIPQDMCCHDLESLMNFIYPNVHSVPPPPPEYLLN